MHCTNGPKQCASNKLDIDCMTWAMIRNRNYPPAFNLCSALGTQIPSGRILLTYYKKMKFN